ncbi:hypothetical protein CFP56_026145 [Quercus suber]|uniref:Uncharacterized protein n=1 Tax=Quercus suber TaxID=58331 RepID=A0AAW0K2B2_QUESU
MNLKHLCAECLQLRFCMHSPRRGHCTKVRDILMHLMLTYALPAPPPQSALSRPPASTHTTQMGIRITHHSTKN